MQIVMRRNSFPNLFANIPESLPDELVQTLISAGGVRVERIVSRGHSSPAGFWYDQPMREWVVVLKGGGESAV